MRLSFAFLSLCCITNYGYAAEKFSQQLQTLSTELAQYTPVNPQQRYQHYKAKLWLSYARHEWSERSSTQAAHEAFSQAQHINQALQQQTALSDITPILTVSQVMRRDLWAQLAYLKQSPALQYAPEAIAHAEVQLVWAAAEYCELGWRHAKPHFRAAEQAITQSFYMLGMNPVTVYDEHMPSLAQLNGQGCQGVNLTIWPMHAPFKSQHLSSRIHTTSSEVSF